MAKFCDFCANDPLWRVLGDYDEDEGEHVGTGNAWFCAMCLLTYDIVGSYRRRS